MKESPENEIDLTKEWKNSRITVFLGATGYTIALVAAISIGAYHLDKFLNTFPAIFITGLIIGFPLTQYLIYRKFKNFTPNNKNNNGK